MFSLSPPLSFPPCLFLSLSLSVCVCVCVSVGCGWVYIHVKACVHQGVHMSAHVSLCQCVNISVCVCVRSSLPWVKQLQVHTKFSSLIFPHLPMCNLFAVTQLVRGNPGAGLKWTWPQPHSMLPLMHLHHHSQKYTVIVTGVRLPKNTQWLWPVFIFPEIHSDCDQCLSSQKYTVIVTGVCLLRNAQSLWPVFVFPEIHGDCDWCLSSQKCTVIVTGVCLQAPATHGSSPVAVASAWHRAPSAIDAQSALMAAMNATVPRPPRLVPMTISSSVIMDVASSIPGCAMETMIVGTEVMKLPLIAVRRGVGWWGGGGENVCSCWRGEGLVERECWWGEGFMKRESVH